MKLHLTNLYGMAGDSTVILAQNAVQKIASQLGFREVGIYFYNIASDSPSEMNKRLDGIMASISIGDILVFQSPTWNGFEFDRLLFDKLKDMQVKIICFIHDVVPLMFDSNYYLMKDYMYMYNLSDVLIVPSERMKTRLMEEGLTTKKILVQGMWDHPHDLSLYTPAFKKDEELLLELSKGGFGLVWGTHQNDGESNQYYTLNISHKVSTYLTAGIPVIVPSNLSTAKFIVDQGLGFMADSLEEVHAIVDKMNLQEYQEMTNRIKTFSYLLKEGYFTKKLLVDAIYHLGID
ncbi:TPA: sugar transferase [Streptococcus pneumoniae]|nr:sugar transferase [Streptococcus pneumoniae]